MFEEVHGKFGNMVFRHTRNGGLSLIRRADMSKVKWSPAQQANRQRFREAVVYAQQALVNPQRKSLPSERPNEVTVTFTHRVLRKGDCHL